MAWSYNPADLNATTSGGRINTVRLLVGDTDTTDQQVQNEEITFGLTENNDSVYLAGSWVAKVISAKYARLVTTKLDGALSANYSDLAKQYLTLSDQLEAESKKDGSAIGVLAGGLTKSGVEAVRANTNRIEGSFRRDRFKNPPSYNTPEYE